MLSQALNNLSLLQRQLYSLIGAMVLVGFVTGFVWVALGFNIDPENQDIEWSTSSVSAAVGVDALQQIIARNPRWYRDANAKVEDLQGVAAAGAPESFRVVGVVIKGSGRYAVFMPLANSATSQGAPALIQRKEGQRLTGGWIIARISPSEIELQQGEARKTLKVYDAAASVKEQPKSRRARK